MGSGTRGAPVSAKAMISSVSVSTRPSAEDARKVSSAQDADARIARCE